MPASYSDGTGPGIYPYEYTVTDLSNGITYLFAVRAEDSADPPHEDSNTVTWSAIPGPTAAPGVFRWISIDGNFSDWEDVPWTYQGAPDGNIINFAKVQFANDTNYLYCHFTLFAPAAPFADYNTHVFFDCDNTRSTGYQVSGAAFGSEMMIESGASYDERNGAFNAGTLSGLGWALAPVGTSSEFEFRVSLATAYAGGVRVFGTNAFRILLQDNRGDEVAGATGLLYRIVPPPPYALWRARFFTPAELTNPAISGDTADPDGDSIVNFVEYAFNLNPRVADHPSLPRAFLEHTAGATYLDVQFTRRNAPTDVAYLPQTSNDLRVWNPASATELSAVDNGDGTSLVTLRILSDPETVSPVFVRIAVSKTQP